MMNQGKCFKDNEQVLQYLDKLKDKVTHEDGKEIEQLMVYISQIGERLDNLQINFNEVKQLIETMQSPKTSHLKLIAENVDHYCKQLKQQFNDITKDFLNTLKVEVKSCKANVQLKAVNTLGLHDKLCHLKKMLITTNSAIQGLAVQTGNVSREFHNAKRSFANVGRALVGKQTIANSDIQKINAVQMKLNSFSSRVVAALNKTENAIKRIECIQRKSVKEELKVHTKATIKKQDRMMENVR